MAATDDVSRNAEWPRSLSWSGREPAAVLVLVAAFLVLRSSGLGGPLAEAWAVLASVVALISPLAGLLTAVALGPFDDWPVFGTEAGGRAVLVAAIAISVGGRAMLGASWSRQRWVIGTPVGLTIASAVVLLIGTGLGVVHTWLRFGPVMGYQAAQLWATGTGMALIVCLIGVWFGSGGERRPALVAGFAAVAAVGVGLLHEALPTLIPSSALAWLIVEDRVLLRLSGVMNAPNSMAMLALLPACLIAAWMLQRRSWRPWLAGSAALVMLGVAVLLTYSRSAVLAVAAVAVSYAWFVKRTAALVILAVVVVGAAVLVPIYVDQRAGNELPGAGLSLQDFFTAGDEVRSAGWAAAVRMALDSPLIGQGFRSYLVLHTEFGDLDQTAPHNEWLRLYAEEGVIVGTAGLFFLAAALMALWRVRGALALGAFGTLLAYAIMASFNNPLNYAQLNVPVFALLGTALGLALRAEIRAPRAARSDRLSDPAAAASKGSSAAGS